jgi:hypothetical protein
LRLKGIAWLFVANLGNLARGRFRFGYDLFCLRQLGEEDKYSKDISSELSIKDGIWSLELLLFGLFIISIITTLLEDWLVNSIIGIGSEEERLKGLFLSPIGWFGSGGLITES